MKLKVYSPDAKTSREQEFELPVFEGNRGVQALKQVIVAIRANQRLGTHSTKRRGEVRGGGKKPWNQKGSGRARAGSIRSPLWPGGGVVFGPKPRDYAQKINGKVKSLAFSRALFERAVAGEIEVIEAWQVAPAKTKVISELLTRIAPKGMKQHSPSAAQKPPAQKSAAKKPRTLAIIGGKDSVAGGKAPYRVLEKSGAPLAS